MKKIMSSGFRFSYFSYSIWAGALSWCGGIHVMYDGAMAELCLLYIFPMRYDSGFWLWLCKKLLYYLYGIYVYFALSFLSFSLNRLYYRKCWLLYVYQRNIMYTYWIFDFFCKFILYQTLSNEFIELLCTPTWEILWMASTWVTPERRFLYITWQVYAKTHETSLAYYVEIIFQYVSFGHGVFQQFELLNK